MLSLGTCLLSKHSQDMLQGSTSGPKEDRWTRKNVLSVIFARLAATLMVLLPSWSAPVTLLALADGFPRPFCTYTRALCATSGDGSQKVC